MPNLLQLSAPTIDDLRQRVRDEHGPLARIVSAEKVIPRGIGRIRKPTYFEAVIELPDAPPTPPAAPPPAPRVALDPAAVHGIAALLADAEQAEDAGHAESAGPVEAAKQTEDAGHAQKAGHTENAGRIENAGPVEDAKQTEHAVGRLHRAVTDLTFDEVMQRLGEFAVPPAPAPAPVAFHPPFELEAAHAPMAVPVPPGAPGDLVAVVSVGQDALPVAQAMCRSFGRGELRRGGTIRTRGHAQVTDRRSAFLARAEAVEHGTVVFCAFGVEPGNESLQTLRAIDPDQVWVVVDAGRKPEDTQRWLDQVADVVNVAALAVVGAASTATPHTVNSLGVPVGWVDGSPALAARL